MFHAPPVLRTCCLRSQHVGRRYAGLRYAGCRCDHGVDAAHYWSTNPRRSLLETRVLGHTGLWPVERETLTHCFGRFELRACNPSPPSGRPPAPHHVHVHSDPGSYASKSGRKWAKGGLVKAGNALSRGKGLDPSSLPGGVSPRGSSQGKACFRSIANVSETFGNFQFFNFPETGILGHLFKRPTAAARAP